MRRLQADPLLTHFGGRALRAVVVSNVTDPLLTHSFRNAAFIGHWPVFYEKGMSRKPMPNKQLHSKAGDRIRTDDVQLGKMPCRP